MPLVVRTLSDQIYEVLRQRIMMHEIKPGHVIRQDALAAELGVSKIPVREALSRLEGGGMVQSAANRGYIASPLSACEIMDIFTLRMLIEPATAAATAVAATDAERDEVTTAYETLLKGGANFRDTMMARRRMMLSLLIQEDRPTHTSFVVQLFDRAERYHPPNPTLDFLGVDSLDSLTTAWLARDAEATLSVYKSRLEHRAADALATLPLLM